MVDDPRHELRDHLDARLAELATRLREDPALIARGEELKAELLEHPELRAWTASLWSDAKASLALQAADPDSPAAACASSGRWRASASASPRTPALQAKIDSGLSRFAGYVLDEYAGTLSEIIESTVERWDPGVVTDQLELLLGRDLQFIRINGTLVGGLIGLVLHTFSQLL